MRSGFTTTLVVAGLLAVSTATGSPVNEPATAEDVNDVEALQARKREPMKLVDELDNKLPKELQRRLLIISMKIKRERKRLCEHPEWPDTGMLRQSSPEDDESRRERK